MPLQEPRRSADEMRVLELFCGLGGMRLGLERALAAAGDRRPRTYTAVDTSPTAAAAYEANFPGAKCHRKNIESLPASTFEGHDVWMMSPPCQPFTATANAHQRDLDDPRCSALKAICALLPSLASPPRHIVLENVVPFATSDARKLVEAAFAKAGYSWRSYLLDPPAVSGSPAHRRRFYFAAERSARFAGEAAAADREAVEADAPPAALRPVAGFLDPPAAAAAAAAGAAAPATVSEATLAKPWARGLSYVGDHDTNLFCFTSGYSKVMHKSSGSLYFSGAAAPLASEAGALDKDALPALAGRIRHFTPTEVLAFLDFPRDYAFPDTVDRRRQYKAAGASVNVAVVARLCESLMLMKAGAGAPAPAGGNKRPRDEAAGCGGEKRS